MNTVTLTTATLACAAFVAATGYVYAATPCGDTCAPAASQCTVSRDTHKTNPTVTTEQLATLLASDKNVTVVDARAPKNADDKCIPGAISLSPNATPEQIKAALPDTNATIVTYCSSTQCPASAALAKVLNQHGYTAVIRYPEGIAGWVAAGKATTPRT
jgi:rhodanese-related sulfurtransferase